MKTDLKVKRHNDRIDLAGEQVWGDTGQIILLLVFLVVWVAVWIGVIAFYHFISRYEEKLLLNKFGAEYEKYLNEVAMWIPRFRISL